MERGNRVVTKTLLCGLPFAFTVFSISNRVYYYTETDGTFLEPDEDNKLIFIFVKVSEHLLNTLTL